jgi:hypothetical protein
MHHTSTDEVLTDRRLLENIIEYMDRDGQPVLPCFGPKLYANYDRHLETPPLLSNSRGAERWAT